MITAANGCRTVGVARGSYQNRQKLRRSCPKTTATQFTHTRIEPKLQGHRYVMSGAILR
jgi:hypothetical protein